MTMRCLMPGLYAAAAVPRGDASAETLAIRGPGELGLRPLLRGLRVRVGARHQVGFGHGAPFADGGFTGTCE